MKVAVRGITDPKAVKVVEYLYTHPNSQAARVAQGIGEDVASTARMLDHLADTGVVLQTAIENPKYHWVIWHSLATKTFDEVIVHDE